MVEQVLLVSLFTFIIHLSETLTYSLRLAGVRLGKLAVAMSLSGIILLISRTANMVQALLTGKILDYAKHNQDYHLIDQFRIIIGAAALGTFTALLLFPSAVLLSSRVISHLEVAGSIPQMIRSSVSFQKINNARYHFVIQIERGREKPLLPSLGLRHSRRQQQTLFSIVPMGIPTYTNFLRVSWISTEIFLSRFF